MSEPKSDNESKSYPNNTTPLRPSFHVDFVKELPSGEVIIRGKDAPVFSDALKLATKTYYEDRETGDWGGP